MASFVYTLALFALLPYVWLHLWLRSRKQPDYLAHLGERFGFYPAQQEKAESLVWLHGVSVGETRAAAPIIAALKARYPGRRILLTHMTPTGRRTSEELFGDGVLRAYLPYDYPFAVRRFLRRFRPGIGVILETELWPNVVAECQKHGVPLMLVNARLSEKSARRYARFAGLTRAALEGLTAIAAQTEADAARLRALGAPHVEVLGNVKFDILPPPEQLALGETLRKRIDKSLSPAPFPGERGDGGSRAAPARNEWMENPPLSPIPGGGGNGGTRAAPARTGARPVLLAASTREGEEALIFAALAKRPLGNTLLVVVPRHPQRFDDVAALATKSGFTVRRRSEETPITAETQVLIGDSMGELFAYYAACDVAFIGGSLLDYGSQNLIEACAVGRPVLMGRSTYNFSHAAQEALACGAAKQIDSAEDLLEAAAVLFADESARQRMGEAGKAFAERHRGATAKTMALIEACGLIRPTFPAAH